MGATLNTEEFVARLADVLELSAVDEHALLVADRWDSLAHLSTIALIDELYGITVPFDELIECRSVGDIVNLVRQRV